MAQNALDDLFTLLDCVPTPIFVMDVTDGDVPVYAHYNSNALSRLGVGLSDIVGKTSIEAFGEEWGTAAFLEQRKTISAGISRDYEFQLPLGDEVRVVRTTLVPQRDGNGDIKRLVGSSQDDSMEWIANTAQTKLNNISTEVEQFIAMAAHDLRTPMRNVMQLTEMLQEDFEDKGDGKSELLHMLKDTSEKSMSLITDVLSYASSFSPDAPPVLYCLRKLGDDVMAALDPQKMHVLQCTDITLAGEKNMMQIVLRNLIDNALKHGGRSQMALTCDAQMNADGHVEVTLSDNGTGFDNPGAIFLETGHFRADSGYGLLAVRKLIMARSGSIYATNDLDSGGSCVTFTLPCELVVPKGSTPEQTLAKISAA